jgi:uncharacterized protein (DUF433 family)
MRRVLGIEYVEEPAGRRAVLAGVGPDVWEVISAFKECGGCRAALRSEFPWLSDLQLHTAFAYYRLRAEEIDSRLDRERHWTPERVREEFPFLSPQSETSTGTNTRSQPCT